GSWALARANQILAESQIAQDRSADALQTLKEIEDVIGDEPIGRRHFVNSNILFAIANLDVGRPEIAEPILRRVADEREHVLGNDYPSTAEARGLLAVSLYRQKELAPALAVFEQAVPKLMAPRGAARDAKALSAVQDQIAHRIIETYMAAL